MKRRNSRHPRVNLIRAALFAAAPENRPALFSDLSRREGIRLLPAEADDRIEAMPDSRFHKLIQRELATLLGPRTRVAAEVDGVSGFWVSFRLDDHDEDEYWLILPRERATRSIAGSWLIWGLLALLLALAVAWQIASRITRPLKAMANSAKAVGHGQRPTPLPESGAVEMRLLASAFNTMASDLERHEQDRSEVLAGISHDLRTPLTRLRLEAEMSVTDEAARQGIVNDIEQMEAVISQFMDYARTELGEIPVTTDLVTLLSGMVERLRQRGRQITFTADDLPDLPVRPRALIRAVTNLLDNALKYGGGEVSLNLAKQARRTMDRSRRSRRGHPGKRSRTPQASVHKARQRPQQCHRHRPRPRHRRPHRAPARRPARTAAQSRWRAAGAAGYRLPDVTRRCGGA